MNKPEPIYLTESDAIDSFAPEAGGEPRRTARDSYAEPLDAFRSEVFAQSEPPRTSAPRTSAPPRASAPLRTRHRIHPASLVAVAGIAAVFAVVVMQQSNTPESRAFAPAASPRGGSTDVSPTPALPPVTAAPVPPSTSEANVEPSQQSVTTAESQPPPVVQPDVTARAETAGRLEVPVRSEPPVGSAPTVRPEPPARSDSTPSTSPAASARMPRPLSQDPARLSAGVTTPGAPTPAGASTGATSPRDGPDVPVARPPSTAATAPAAEAAARTPASTSPSPAPSPPPPSAAATPSPSAPSPSPPAVTPPTAAATPSSTPPPSATVARPPASAAAPPAAAAAVIDRNTTAIQNTLARYRQAFNALSASAAREVWPTVNERSLSRAFDQLEEQQVSFDGCNVQVNESDRAEAVCSGSARYVPRVGSRTPRTERREWHFNLVKQRDEWMIGAVDTR